MKNQVDPSRFADKTFTRRKAFPTSTDDYVILIDGCVARRIMNPKPSAARLVLDLDRPILSRS